MTLEPEVVTAETGPSAEYLDMRRRFWTGLVLAVPVLMLEMAGHLTNLHMLPRPRIGFSSFLRHLLSYGQAFHSSSAHGSHS